MEKTNLHYSKKNIPIASERNYKMKLIEKIEAVIKRMRWKAIFVESDKEEETTNENFGLKTTNTPQQVPELVEFEKELIEIIPKLKFRKGMSNFQLKLKQDIKAIKESDKIYAPADKTSNMYMISKENYNKLLTNSITASYKKSDNNTKYDINNKGKEILKNHQILERMDINGENNCFITLKDHKENFLNNPTTRLINPAKNELGRISKVILEKVNKEIKLKMNLNQWNSTADVIDWFVNIRDKKKHKFIMFDVKDFYPSINEELLHNALQFAYNFIRINEKEKEIILHSRKSLLFNNKEAWAKKGNSLFDVTMGAYDGAEVCELVGCFLLSQITERYNTQDIGLYRDDGLAIFKNISGHQSEKIKKEFQTIFRKNNLEIIVECNMKAVNYLDVTLDLETETYRPYCKPDNETNYVHAESNHPPNITKQIPISIQTRLSNLSSDEKIFHKATPYYEEALKRSGYNHEFKYKPNKNQQRNKRRRKIIWFNPPYNKNLTTNIGRFFINLVKKHFPQQHKYHKIFNKNTIKVSYSCMPNVKSTIDAHNKKLLFSNTTNESTRLCNCTNQETCPLSQKCLTSNIVYEATIKSNLHENNEKKYIGLCETSFKKRYNGHKTSFRLEKYKNNTALSTEYWKIKEKNGNPVVSWKIIANAKSYKPESKKCSLCQTEKYEIANYPGKNLLNKRSEIIAKCRHRRKHQLMMSHVRESES